MNPNRKFRLDDAPENLRKYMTPQMRDKTRDRAVAAWTAILEEVAQTMRPFGFRAWAQDGVHRFGRETDEVVIVVSIEEGRIKGHRAGPGDDPPEVEIGEALYYDPYTDAIVGRIRAGAYTREGEPVRDSPLAVLVNEILTGAAWERM